MEQVLEKKSAVKEVPQELIYEMKDGVPIYYRDYEKVLSGEKSLEEVMGSSKIQWYIVYLLFSYLLNNLDKKKYVIATNEAGFQWKPKSWRSLDIAVFDREKLLSEGIDNRYTKTPPEVVIEVDTKADLKGYGDILSYMKEKTQDLLDGGVKRVIWYTTDDKKVLV
ncbi:MAG: Uma2 family endonuclease, partial [Aquificae bacterium]|nr:Uma2 family endonuclease [Aquificota bacterium]